ncbi:MAG TPA: cytochrome c biogenesis protein DipZ [Candidatus Paceibacterota bacterium]|nr:cytochrome c biogenesis protein DipZ [Candidatus Paceibacterota bacterium]
MTLLVIAFVAGLLTVLAPCTLPLLPVIIGGSVSGESNIRRALIISGSLGASVFLFTLLLKASTLFINIPQEFWDIISGSLLIIFGLVTLFPKIWDKFTFANELNLGGNRLLATGYTKKSIWGDVIMGAALGPVFSSCSPTYFIVLATVLPVHPAQGVVYLLAYSIGLIFSLLAVSIVGQSIVRILGIASNPEGWFKRTIGALFLIIGLIIITGYSTTLESDLLSHAGMFDITQVEQRLLGSQNSNSTTTPMIGLLTPAQKAQQYQPAPELQGIDGYLNTNGQPISLAQYKGKDVVLIDFWTYSCINCLRTLPYLNAWYDKYKDQGLVIIGVETPEFAFEHIEGNVSDAIARLGIKYPVVQDNEYKTWNAFNNEYWPNEYLVDIDGYIVHTQSGEGDYDVTEKAIQEALAERAVRLGIATSTPLVLNAGTVPIPQADLSGINSPETYFGSNRNEYFGNGQPGVAGTNSYMTPASISPDTFYLGGTWNIEPEYAESESTGGIEYEYDSSDLYFVAASDGAPVQIQILRDGKPLDASIAGADVDPKTSTATIQGQRLYNLIKDTAPGVHTIEIKVMGKGLQAYTFTFG